MPDGSVVPLMLPGGVPEAEPADELEETVTAAWEPDPEPIQLTLDLEDRLSPALETEHTGMSEMRVRMAAQHRAELNDNQWAAISPWPKPRGEVDLMLLQESVARELARNYWSGLWTGAAATLAVSVVWSVVERLLR